MYAPAQVKAKHPKSGEVMLGGEMAMMGAARPGRPSTTSRSTSASRTARLRRSSSRRSSIDDPKAMMGMERSTLPVAIMQGVGEGIADYHYGNELALTPGHAITVTVTVKGQRAVFHAKVPKKT